MEDLAGRVFDNTGTVTQPLHVVRFNSEQHIEERGVTVGMKVFYAPKLTSNVFLEHLMPMKISDASWASDKEPPFQILDHSDDEEEQRVKRESKAEVQQQLGDSGEATETKRQRENSVRQGKNLRQCSNGYNPDSNVMYV